MRITWKRAVIAIIALYLLIVLFSWVAWRSNSHGGPTVPTQGIPK